MTRAGVLLVFLALVAATRSAHGSPGGSGYIGWPGNETWVLAGGNAGLVIGHGDTSWLLGAEASIVHIGDEGGWYGGYADIVDDANHEGARVSLGGEIGIGLVGLDLGPVIDLGGDLVSIRFRGVVTSGAVSLYFGPVIPVAGSADHDSWSELGILVKLPRRL